LLKPLLPRDSLAAANGTPLTARTYEAQIARILKAGVKLASIENGNTVEIALPDFTPAGVFSSLSILSFDRTTGRQVGATRTLTAASQLPAILQEETRFGADFGVNAGKWTYRADLNQRNDLSTNEDPWVSVLELNTDKLTGVRVWAVLFEGDLDNRDTPRTDALTGNYNKEEYTYYDRSLNFFVDTDNEGFFNKGDEFLGRLNFGDQSPQILDKIAKFNPFATGSGLWTTKNSEYIEFFDASKTFGSGELKIPSNIIDLLV